MGLRDKLRSKKSKDQPAAAPVAGAVPSAPPSAFGGGGGRAARAAAPVDPKAAAAPRMPVDPKAAAAGHAFARPGPLAEERAAAERETRALEGEKELYEKIKRYKAVGEMEEKKLDALKKKKREVVGKLKVENDRRIKDDLTIARLKKQIRRFNDDIQDVNGRITRNDEAVNTMQKKLEQRRDIEDIAGFTEALDSIKVDADKVEDVLYDAKEKVQETQEVRGIINGIPLGEEDPAPDELDDDMLKELAMYDEQEEEEKAKLAVSASADDAVARIEGVGATPTVAPGRVATSAAADDEEMMADLEKEMAM